MSAMASRPFPSIFIIFFFVFCCYFFSASHTSTTIGVDSISRLLEIQDGERAPPSVQFKSPQLSGVLRRPPSFSFFQLPLPNCLLRISGTTGVEIAAGLHWYLKHSCGSHISWDKTGGAQLFSVPKMGYLPRIKGVGILIQRPIPWSYYQNPVTSSFTFAWWDWKIWEKEIDWMALQGVNLSLAFIGQEAIWQKVFRNFKMTTSDLNDLFGGPAFLAWSRMGNLHGWGGPLPQSWLDQQLILQKKFLSRMYELGMNPVLPAFAGNVPAALKYIFPSAKISRLGNWGGSHLFGASRARLKGAISAFLCPIFVTKLEVLTFGQNIALVVEETIRMSNAAGTTTKDIEYKGYIIPKGWSVLPWIRYAHTNPENFDDPMFFNPDRWKGPAKPETYSSVWQGDQETVLETCLLCLNLPFFFIYP